MFERVYLFLALAEIVFGGIAVHNNIAGTIMHCFSAYCCLQFMWRC